MVTVTPISFFHLFLSFFLLPFFLSLPFYLSAHQPSLDVPRVNMLNMQKEEYEHLLVELKNLKMIVMGHERRIRNMEFKLGERERELDRIKSQREKDPDPTARN